MLSERSLNLAYLWLQSWLNDRLWPLTQASLWSAQGEVSQGGVKKEGAVVMSLHGCGERKTGIISRSSPEL